MYKAKINFIFIFAAAFVFAFGLTNVPAQTQKITSGENRLDLKYFVASGNPAADLDQCANGGVDAVPEICTGAAWQNGNLGRNQAHYLEGQAVPYRLRFSNLIVGSTYTVTIEYDTTEGGKHALDALTSFDMSETTADPCSGVPGCDLSVRNLFAIPVDSNFTAGFDGTNGTIDDIPPIIGNFTMFNGEILAVSDYTMTGSYLGSSQTSIVITFKATATNPVLAWGGHISTRVNWGIDNSAIAISGSPYHMRLMDLNGSGGNQDRSLSSDATIFPGKIVIIKDARPDTNIPFGFTAAGPHITDFVLVDDGSSSNTLSFNNITSFGTTNSTTITEDPPTNSYFLIRLSCIEDPSGGLGQQNSTVTPSTRTVNLILEEGETITCTFVNALPTSATASISGRITAPLKGYIYNAIISVVDSSTGEIRFARANPFGYYQIPDLPVGQTYIVQVSAKGYVFNPDSRVISLTDDLTDVDFEAFQK